MKTQRPILVLSLLVLLLAVPASAQPFITAGIDLFQTLGNNGTVFSFGNDPLPADFFCAGSPPFSGTIDFEGSTLDTIPAGITGPADTIVERLMDVNLSSGVASVPIVVRALGLNATQPLVINCASGPTQFNVSACNCGNQPITQIQLYNYDAATSCGNFSGQLSINTCLTFTSAGGTVLGPVSQFVDLRIDNMSWCETGLPGSLQVNQPFYVGSCGFSASDYVAVPPTSNFFPGSVPSTGPSCLDLWGFLTECHSSYGTAPHQHCVNPVCCGSEGVSCPQ
jgi:hypothetical protein